MKFLVALALVIVAVSAVTLEDQFESFQSSFGKRYYGAEYAYRLKVFESNMKIAEQRNKEDSAVHGVTQFSDLTPAEFRKQYLSKMEAGEKLAKACLKTGIYHTPSKIKDIPDSFDWRDHNGVVNAVQDQKSCGSCWAFSTAGNVEGVVGVAGKPSGTLSSQYIVDCSKGCTSLIYQKKNTTVCNEGCSGGWPWSAMMDIIDQGGLPGEADYPYKGVDQACKGNKGAKTLIQLKNYTCLSVPNGADEKEMAAQLILLGPLSVAVEADSFQSYQKGVLDPSNCPTAYLNHAVLVVGYGHDSTSNKDYWLIKNSWGKSWGEQGYVRLRRGAGRCGINEAVSCAILA
jgi:cathepsin F